MTADDNLTWILSNGYCLIPGKRKARTHHLVEAFVICFPLLHNLTSVSISAMTFKV